MSFASLSNLLDVEYFEGWVGGRLKPDHLGVGAQHLPELGDVAEVFERDFDVGVGSEDITQVSLSAAIDVIDAEDVITLLAEVHESHVGSHARACGEGKVGVLQRRKLPLESESRRVTAASVIEDYGLTWGRLGKG